MKTLYYALGCILLLFIAGCAKNSLLMSQCEQRLITCKQICVDNCRDCVKKGNDITLINYLKYINEQQVEGGMVFRQLKSYYDPLQCRKTTCNCSADYNICIQAKSGVIVKHLEVVPVCS